MRYRRSYQPSKIRVNEILSAYIYEACARMKRTLNAADRKNSRKKVTMQRIGMVIKLKPGSQNAYKKYHAAVWPEILSKISECNIKNYSVFLKDDVLFGYLEYHGSNLEEDWGKMAADAKTQEWWAIMQQ